MIMIRTTIVALSQANATNNYTVLHALGSQSFQLANPPQRLAEIFASFRSNKIDLSPVVLLAPELTTQTVVTGGQLHLVGRFPSRPMQVNFDLSYEQEKGEPQGVWRLSGLAVNLTKVEQPPR